MTDLKLPKFATEAEEAKWWYDNRELVSEEFQKAAKEGRLRRGGVARLLAERGIPLAQRNRVRHCSEFLLRQLREHKNIAAGVVSRIEARPHAIERGRNLIGAFRVEREIGALAGQ